MCSLKFNREPTEENATWRGDSVAEQSFRGSQHSCCSSLHRSELEERECQAKTALLCDLVPEHVVAELVKDYALLNSPLHSNLDGEPQHSLHALDCCSGKGSGVEILMYLL